MPIATRWIEIQAGFFGYLALPPAGSGPGLVLFQEIFGVNEHIRAVAEQYALDGFVVLAPDVFWRQAPRVELGYEGEDRQRALALMQAQSAPALQRDVEAAVQTLRTLPQTAGRKSGALGYCLGGRLAYVAAVHAGIDAAVPFYGGGIHTLLELAGSVRCPLQFHYAETDANIPLDAVAHVRAALPQAEVLLYGGATHGFNCWARASYHAPSAALSHGRALQFLSQALF